MTFLLRYPNAPHVPKHNSIPCLSIPPNPASEGRKHDSGLDSGPRTRSMKCSEQAIKIYVQASLLSEVCLYRRGCFPNYLTLCEHIEALKQVSNLPRAPAQRPYLRRHQKTDPRAPSLSLKKNKASHRVEKGMFQRHEWSPDRSRRDSLESTQRVW